MLYDGATGFIIELFKQSNYTASGFIILSVGSILLIIKTVISRIYQFYTSANFLQSDPDRKQFLNLDILHEFSKLALQFIIYWTEDDQPNIIGNIDQIKEDIGYVDPLKFSSWLNSDDSKLIESALSSLKLSGTTFQFFLRANTGKYFNFEGKIIKNLVTLKITNVDHHHQNYSNLNIEYEIVAWEPSETYFTFI